MSYGSYVRQLRTARGMTLDDLARKIGISAAYWSRIERDKDLPPRDALIESAVNILGSDLDEAFIAAGRLPPDMRPHLPEIVRWWRNQKTR